MGENDSGATAPRGHLGDPGSPDDVDGHLMRVWSDAESDGTAAARPPMFSPPYDLEAEPPPTAPGAPA